MSDNDSGGVLGGLLVGTGFAVILLSPFYIARQFGLHVLAGIVALFSTVIAIFSGDLVAMAQDVGNCGIHCPTRAFAEMIMVMDSLGWWVFAAMNWIVFAVFLFAPIAFRQPITPSQDI